MKILILVFGYYYWSFTILHFLTLMHAVSFMLRDYSIVQNERSRDFKLVFLRHNFYGIILKAQLKRKAIRMMLQWIDNWGMLHWCSHLSSSLKWLIFSVVLFFWVHICFAWYYGVQSYLASLILLLLSLCLVLSLNVCVCLNLSHSLFLRTCSLFLFLKWKWFEFILKLRTKG